MKDVARIYANAVNMATASMTEQHIFALLAYEHKPGTKEKFDKFFGEGAAERVLAEVRKPAETLPPPAPVVLPSQAVTVQMDAAPVTINMPEQAPPTVIIQPSAATDERIAALEKRIDELSKPRKLRVERDINGNILRLEQVAE